MTQQKFAEELGIDRTSLSNYERGKTEIPLYIAKLIAAKYMISEKWLLTGEGSIVEYVTQNDSSGVNIQDEEKLLRLRAEIKSLLKEKDRLDQKIDELDKTLDRLDKKEREALLDSFIKIARLKTT